MDHDSRILVVGQCDWTGAALARRLWAAGFHGVRQLKRKELDLTRQGLVDALFEQERPEYVFLVGARETVEPRSPRLGTAFRESLAIQANVIHAAWRGGARKFCFVASSSIYPAQDLPAANDGSLLTTVLEPEHGATTIAQIAGLRLCQVYRRQYRFDAIGLVPAELYGPGDRVVDELPVLPALIARMHRASLVRPPRLVLDAVPPREFLHVDDLGDAALWAMLQYSDDTPLNVDGESIGMLDLAEAVAAAVGYTGRIAVEGVLTEPPGPPPPDVLRMGSLGWSPCMPLRLGLEQTCAWYMQGKTKEPVA